MWKLILISSVLSLSASAATLKLTLTTEGLDASTMKKATVSFKSSNPLCKSFSVTPMPGVFDRRDFSPVKVNVVSKNKVILETDTLYQKDNFCRYNMDSLTIGFMGYNFVGISSTRNADYSPEKSVLDVLSNRSSEFSAECDKVKAQCDKLVDGRKEGYRSNAVVFFADAKALDKKEGVLNTRIHLKLQ